MRKRCVQQLRERREERKSEGLVDTAYDVIYQFLKYSSIVLNIV